MGLGWEQRLCDGRTGDLGGRGAVVSRAQRQSHDDCFSVSAINAGSQNGKICRRIKKWHFFMNDDKKCQIALKTRRHNIDLFYHCTAKNKDTAL